MDASTDVAPVLYDVVASRLTYALEIEFWNVASTSWWRLPKNAPWDLNPKYTTLPIRAKGVGFTPGLGWEITQLERQHGRGVATSVPVSASLRSRIERTQRCASGTVISMRHNGYSAVFRKVRGFLTTCSIPTLYDERILLDSMHPSPPGHGATNIPWMHVCIIMNLSDFSCTLDR